MHLAKGKWGDFRFRTNTANSENLSRQPDGIPAFQLALRRRAYILAFEARRAVFAAIVRHILVVVIFVCYGDV